MFEIRVPKGFRASGLRAIKCRGPGLQDGKIGALGLHLARIIIFVRASSTEWLWAPGSMAKKMLGLQGSKKDPPF